MSMQLSPGECPIAPEPIEIKCDFVSDNAPLVFTAPFRIGRSSDCEVCIRNEFVSRVHAEVIPEPRGWRVTDLQSSNGLYWRGTRVENVLITSSEVLRLGIEGPELTLQV